MLKCAFTPNLHRQSSMGYATCWDIAACIRLRDNPDLIVLRESGPLPPDSREALSLYDKVDKIGLAHPGIERAWASIAYGDGTFRACRHICQAAFDAAGARVPGPDSEPIPGEVMQILLPGGMQTAYWAMPDFCSTGLWDFDGCNIDLPASAPAELRRAFDLWQGYFDAFACTDKDQPDLLDWDLHGLAGLCLARRIARDCNAPCFCESPCESSRASPIYLAAPGEPEPGPRDGAFAPLPFGLARAHAAALLGQGAELAGLLSDWESQGGAAKDFWSHASCGAELFDCAVFGGLHALALQAAPLLGPASERRARVAYCSCNANDPASLELLGRLARAQLPGREFRLPPAEGPWAQAAGSVYRAGLEARDIENNARQAGPAAKGRCL